MLWFDFEGFISTSNCRVAGKGRLASALILWLVLSILLVVQPFSRPALAEAEPGRQKIIVGYTPLQPPFSVKADGSGLVQDVLALMDAGSPQHYFVQKPLYAGRFAEALKPGSYDLIAFQNKSWGFDAEGTEQSLTLVQDRGAYFALPGWREGEISSGQGGQLDQQLLGATRGFRYGFADFSVEKLETMSHVLLTVNEQDVVKLVVRGRVPLGVASESLLKWHLHVAKNPKPAFQILPRTDYAYGRSFVVLPNSPIKSAEIDRLLLKLAAEGRLQKIFAEYGLSPPPLTPSSGIIVE